MKEIKEEIKTYITKYEAIDGTMFNNKEECEKYDNTAKTVLRSKFQKLILSETTEVDLFNAGSDENSTYAVKMPTEEDADTVKQLYLAYHEWLKSSDNYKAYIDKAFATIDKAFKDEDVLLVGENYEHEIFIINTRNTIVERLTNLDKEQA